MRTKIGKRIGLVPITLVAVFALVALISAGLLLGPNNAEADVGALPMAESMPFGSKCEVYVAGDGDGVDGTVNNHVDDVVSGKGCTTTGGSVDVVFKNGGTSTVPLPFVVYATGGNDFNIQAKDDMGSEDRVDHMSYGKKGLAEHRLAIPATAFGDPGEKTVSVTKSMAKGGVVYLFAYNDTSNEMTPISNTDPELPGLTATDLVVKVVFLGPPVAKDSDGDDQSRIIVNPERVNAGSGIAEITVAILDGNGFAYPGFVDLAVEGGDSVLITESNLKTHRAELGSNADISDPLDGDMDPGTVVAHVEGLPETGAIRIKFTATMAGQTFEKYIVREGDPATVSAMAYECEDNTEVIANEETDLLSVIENPDTTVNICISERLALATKTIKDDPDEVDALAPGDAFILVASVKDELGNDIRGPSISWDIEDADGDAIASVLGTSSGEVDQLRVLQDAAVTDTQENSGVRTSAALAVAENAEFGSYNIIVSSEDAEMMVPLAVSGKASMIMLECMPDPVPTATGQTDCVATVTDDNGNIPSNIDTETTDTPARDTVLVAVRDKDAQIIGANNNRVNITAKGKATFSILFSEDVEEGRSITVNVSATIAGASFQDSSTLMYGEAALEPMPMPMTTELTAPSGVVVSSLANTQSVSVTWDTTSIENAQQVKVVLFNSGVTGLAQVDGALITINAANDMGSHTFSDVPAGMYNVVVASFRTGERHKLSPLQEVTVE